VQSGFGLTCDLERQVLFQHAAGTDGVIRIGSSDIGSAAVSGIKYYNSCDCHIRHIR